MIDTYFVCFHMEVMMCYYINMMECPLAAFLPENMYRCAAK